MNCIKVLFFLALTTLSFLPLKAQELSVDTIQRINEIFQKWDAQTTPGASLAISRQGKLIFQEAWGMANIEEQIANTTLTVFDAASITKQFTAAGILLLEQKKRLSLTDDVRKYIPELPIFRNPVRIRNLINHSSGLNEWNTTLALTGWERGTGTFGNERILEIIAKQKELIHKPGEEFNYVNSNYHLLAIIIERVSNMSLAAFYKKNIFDPLGLSNTYWNDFKKNANTAVGYVNNAGSFKQANATLRGLGSGGIMTTPADLVKWNARFLSGEFSGRQMLRKQLQQGMLNNGVQTPYAAGLNIFDYKGHKTISHDGQGTGYTSFTESYPDLGLSFVLMSNASTLDAINICRQVEAIFINPLSAVPADVQMPFVRLSDERLMRFSGWYKNVRSSAGILLTVKNNRLMSNDGDTLQALSPQKFKMRRNILEFSDTTRSNARLINATFYPDTVKLKPVSPPSYAPEILGKYAGEYHSYELESKIIINITNDTLRVQLPGGKTYKLKPLYKDAFTTEPSIVAASPTYIVFENAIDSITGMRISLYRSRNNFFKRIK